MKIECVAHTNSGVGESPYWDTTAGVLWWVDIPAGLIYRFDPATNTNDQFAFGEPVGCLAVREPGGLVVAAKSGFYYFDPATLSREAIADPERDLPDNRFNDGAIDPQGRLWAGTMCESGGKFGSYYRLDPDGSVFTWKHGFGITNGLAFSPTGDKMYFADSAAATRKIWVCNYAVSTGIPGESAEFFDTANVAGRPDGGTVDADGCYWQAGVDGWQLYRLSPAGELLQTIDLPVERPSKPMFGGANLDVLYVTSIANNITPGTASSQPDAGSLLAIYDLGITGLPQPKFAG